ncbi:hypothetical protein YC2023_010298 [Brassica napus]
MPSLKADSIVKVDRFEVARFSSMYKITDHAFLIHFISPTIIDEVITGAPEMNLQYGWDNPLSRALTSPKKQLESLYVSSLIRKKQSTHNSLYITEIQETIPTYTKAATTSPTAHSSCLMKIAYMPNVNSDQPKTQNSQLTLANIEMKQELCPQLRACAGAMPLIYRMIGRRRHIVVVLSPASVVDKPGDLTLRILSYGCGLVYVVNVLVAAGEIGR